MARKKWDGAGPRGLFFDPLSRLLKRRHRKKKCHTLICPDPLDIALLQ
jgi:hypothetical protein